MFTDKREETHILCDGRLLEISPDIIADFHALPFPDSTFSQVVFDPPHLERAGKKAGCVKNMARWISRAGVMISALELRLTGVND